MTRLKLIATTGLCLLFSSGAQGAVQSNSAAPSVRVGFPCESLGTTVMAENQQSLLACLFLNDGSNTKRWKSMTPLEIDSDGSAGYGTSSPNRAFHVAFNHNANDGSNGQIVVENFGNANAAINMRVTNPVKKSALQFSVGDYLNSSNRAVFAYDHGDRQFQFWTQLNDWAPRVFINENGAVGIGTASPLAPLHVAFKNDVSNGTNGRVVVENTGASNAAINLRVTNPVKKSALQFSVGDYLNSSNRAVFAYDHGDRQFQFWTQLNDWAPRVFINENGAVGIGTNNPSYSLHVNGAVAGNGAYNSLSDERVKKDIVTIANGLDLLEKLRGVRFNWRDKGERTVGKNLELPVDEPQIGLIAQEVEKVLPEAVSTSHDGIKNTQESKIVPVLIEAIKELRAANDALQTRVKDLEEKTK